MTTITTTIVIVSCGGRCGGRSPARGATEAAAASTATDPAVLTNSSCSLHDDVVADQMFMFLVTILTFAD